MLHHLKNSNDKDASVSIIIKYSIISNQSKNLPWRLNHQRVELPLTCVHAPLYIREWEVQRFSIELELTESAHVKLYFNYLSTNIINMFTNPFERKHSSLRQALDRFIKGETRLSFRKKTDLSKSTSSSTSSMASSTMDYKQKFSSKRWGEQCVCCDSEIIFGVRFTKRLVFVIFYHFYIYNFDESY